VALFHHSIWIALMMLLANETLAQRERTSLDDGWRFALGHAADVKADFGFGSSLFSNAKAGAADGPAAVKFDDSQWRRVDLPHDWAVELPFDPHADVSNGGKPIGLQYPATSVGWYRRRLDVPASDRGRRISVEFDGVFRDSRVYLNGHFLGRFASGYDSFRCDLADLLNYGGENILALRVDASLHEGWFYEGAGIYRHVWLRKTAPIHLTPDGVFVSPDVRNIDGAMGQSARVTSHVRIANDSHADASIDVEQKILDSMGKELANGEAKEIQIVAGQSAETKCELVLDHPALWSVESPTLYVLVTTVRHGGASLDTLKTTFGVRSLAFDKDRGFFLNGKHLLIKGVCCHQDHAGVGVALPDPLQEFRVRRLKEMGANALRTSHNPPTPELLDVCDRLGMLVLDENRQTGTSREAMDGLANLVLRDRNHPSVFLWSVGNEEWAIEGNEIGRRVVEQQRKLVHRLDPTRLVTTAISGGWGNGSSRSVDVMGFNYYTHGDVDKYHAEHPDQPCIGTEEASTFSTRGIYVDDKANAHLSADDTHAPDWGSLAETWVNFYAKRPFVAGAFVWTGFDYRGEPTPFQWPAISSQFGICDTCGFPKDNFYYYQSVWSDTPMVHLLPHWNWPGKEGKTISVRTYSNGEEVELFLNEQSLGRKKNVLLSHLQWDVKFEPGMLRAIACKGGKEVASDTVATTGPAVAVRLIPDRTTIAHDGRDVAVVTVQAIDGQGRVVPTAANLIQFSLKGAGKIIGVGNGDPSSHEADVYIGDATWKRSLFTGLAQIIVQSTQEAGALDLISESDGLKSGRITIQTTESR
jgi:beta-galactosidase